VKATRNNAFGYILVLRQNMFTYLWATGTES